MKKKDPLSLGKTAPGLSRTLNGCPSPVLEAQGPRLQ